MGTNFYIRGHRHSYSHHLGKRSAAGMYCWDCGITLNKKGNEDIHQGCRNRSHPQFCNCGWYDACPVCGEKPEKESLSEGSAGRELGFNKSAPGKKTGVASCSSFTWAMAPEKIPLELKDNDSCPCCRREYEDKDKVIENEYGDLFTWDEFMAVLDECPVKYTNSIGENFS
jgi:hypothetical protein